MIVWTVRSVDNAVALAMHHILQHLETGTYARVLFVDFSSAFNTIIPRKLFNKLIHMGVERSLRVWILDFLQDRPQSVRIGKQTSKEITLNVGAPQGCVLSPLLFSLFTNDSVSSEPSVVMIKFSDDTTLEGLIHNSDESAYRGDVARLAGWCSENDLELNVSKTKEKEEENASCSTHYRWRSSRRSKIIQISSHNHLFRPKIGREF